MKVIPPLEITNARLTSSTVPEVPTSSGAWSSGTSYPAGSVVSRTTTNSIYRALVSHSASSITPESSILTSNPVWVEIGSNEWSAGTYSPGQKVHRTTLNKVFICLVSTAAAPSLAPENLSSGGVFYWVEAGPSNRFAMFDYLRNTGTSAQEIIHVRITPGQRITDIGFVGLHNVASIRVRADTSASDLDTDTNVAYDVTKTLTQRETRSWFDYFFDKITYGASAIFEGIPLDTNIIVDIVITGSNLICGGCVLGYAEYIGTVQRGATNDAINFSGVTRDNFGKATLVPRRSIPKTNQTLVIPATLVNTVRKVRDQLNATPALWVGLEDIEGQYYFESLLIMGFYKTFSITLDNPIAANISLELEEI